MSDAITIITPKSLEEARSLAGIISKSSLLSDAFRGKEAETLMAIMTGAEIGLAPMQSLRAIEVIKGKPTLKAEAMTALVRARRDVCEYLVIRRSDATICTMETKRVGDPAPTVMSFSIDDAKAAGLTSNDNYKKYAPAMLRARAGSAICKAVYSDLILGLYDPDELAPEREAAPRASPPTHIVDVTPSALPASVERDPCDAPVSERAKLEVALAEAQDMTGLNALVERITRLSAADKARVRVAWGARRDELALTPWRQSRCRHERPSQGRRVDQAGQRL
jgi:hypothetical protein